MNSTDLRNVHVQAATKGFGKALHTCNRAKFHHQRYNAEGAFELSIELLLLPGIQTLDTPRHSNTKERGKHRYRRNTQLNTRKGHLAQHVILLHVVDLPRAYFPFERVLKELPADVDQQGCEGPVLRAAEGLVVAAGGGSPVSQDHPNYESWKRVKNA